MKSQRFLLLSVVILLLVCLVAPVASMAQAKPATGTKAGNISALLPVATIDRGTGKNKTTVEAKKGDEVIWNDLVKTQKGGRARITLNDSSVLSLGSQAELRILKHDSRTQQTALQLAYGRVRAEVASVTRDGGKFELRTPTAVAGVIGTDFGTDSSIPGVTTFLCISGIVTVGNVDNKVPGTVPCPAGSTTSVSTGLPPTPPKPATQEQIQKLISDTSAAVISSMSPASAFQGKTLLAAVSGTKMTGINEVTVSGSGVAVSLAKPSTETGLEVNLQIAADATAGPRTISFTKANGQSATSIFTVLAPPKEGGTQDVGALQKAYLDIIEQERLSEIAGLNAIGVGVQQSAGEALAQILDENKKNGNPVDQEKIEQHFAQEVAPLLAALDAAGKKVNEDTAAAVKDFVGHTTPDAKKPVPTDFGKVVKDTFDKSNAALLEKFKLTHDALGKEALGINAKLNGSPDWLKGLQGESVAQKLTPKADADERSYDQGLMASFDASRSKGSASSSIAGFSWVLCDPSYKPQQVGVPIPASDNKCRPLQGYASTTSDFRFQTCNLSPQDYIVRVTVVDDKQKSASMDMRLKVLKGEYEDPTTRLQSAAAAFQTLQSDRFMSFFDTGFANYGSLSESIRRTFEGLASMTINLRVSQASINCNEATVRADWQQNYTFKADQSCNNLPAGTACQRVVFTQTEQLTTRMQRVADSAGSRILGWNIVDFQGDNGTVQGTPPGPRTLDVALPDLEVVALAAVTGPRAARENSANIQLGVPPGPNAFEAVIRNVGTGPLSAPARVRFVALGPNNVEVASDVQDVPIPLGINGSVAVIGHMNIPDLGAGVPIRITATVNPGCGVPEANCDGNNIQLLDLLIGIIDLKVASITPVGTYIGTQPGAVSVVVTNIGTRTSVASINNLRVGLALTSLLATGVSIPALAPGASVTLTVPFTVPNLSGAQAIVAAISPGSQLDFNTANDSATGSITITPASVDLQISPLAFSAGTPLAPPFTSGESHTVKFDVKNLGNITSFPNDNFNCRLVSPTLGTSQQLGFLPLPLIAPGATLTGLTIAFVMPPNFAGADTLTCTVSSDPFETAANLANNAATIAVQVNPNIDLQLVNVPVPNGADQMGGNSSVSFGVKNFGLDTAPTGYNVLLRINGNAVTSTTGPQVQGGATVLVTLNYVNPQIGAAPQDVNVPASLEVNANAFVPETNTANNIVTRTLRLVDFTLTTVPTGPLSAISGRSFNTNAVTILPTTYPLPINVFYPGAPAGLTNAGPSGTQIGSNNITGAPGSYTLTPTAAVQGVTHTATPITVQLGADIGMSLGTAFGLTSNGSPQPFQVQVTGGVNPVSLTLNLPPGITIAGGPPATTTVSSPGTVGWNLQADTTAQIGSGLTNIVVTATDPGIGANNVGAGNKVFAPPYSNGGFDNYVVTLGNPVIGPPYSLPNPGIGPDALQVGIPSVFTFGITNNGNLGQGGNVQLTIACSPSCGSPITNTVTAPAPGQTVFTTMTLTNTSLSPGAYSAAATISTAPAQSTTSDDTSPSFRFDVFDFSVTNGQLVAVTPIQNVPFNGSGTIDLTVTEPSAAVPINLALVATSTSGNTNTNAPATVAAGSNLISMFRNASVNSGDPDTLKFDVSRLGITKTVTQKIQYYSASLDNLDAGQPGDVSASHIIMPVGGFGTTVNYRLSGDFSIAGGTSTFTVTTSNGITANISALPTRPGDTFSITYNTSVAGGTTPNLETVITLTATIPNTFPAQTITKQVYLFPVPVPVLNAITPARAGISSSRSYGGTDPLVSGEGAEFNIQVSNTGGGASSSNLPLTLTLGGVTVFQSTIPTSIPAGQSYGPILVHIRAPEPVATDGANTLVLKVGADPLEANPAPNSSSPLAVATSDWFLTTTTGASNTSPIGIVAPGGSSTLVRAIASLTGGLIRTPVNVVLGGSTTNIVATPPVGPLVPPPTGGLAPEGTVTLTVNNSVAPAGHYGVPLVGQIKDGGVTSQRGATIYVDLNGGTPVTSVSITSSVNNAQVGQAAACGSCTVRQINGYLVDQLDITATGGTGTTDLIFSDDPVIVSNVSIPGGVANQPYLTGVQYGSPRTIGFSPLDNNGQVSPGPAKVIISPSASTTSARGFPIQPTVGANQTTLYFNIGDINVTQSCIALAPGVSTHVVLGFVGMNGFDQPTLSYNWTSFAGQNVTLAQSNSGIVSTTGPGTYNTVGFDFTNHNATDILNNSFPFTFDVSIQSTINGSTATKHFTIVAKLSASATCPSARREGSSLGGGIFATGYWSRGGTLGSATSSAQRATTLTATGKLPDLQIKSTDVSISPSVPKSGDKIDVRFKVTNAGTGAATEVPIALQVNGVTVATDKYDLAAGASTLAALQWTATMPNTNVQTERLRRSPRGGGDVQSEVQDAPAPPVNHSASGFDVKLVIDPTATVPQATATFKAVQLSKMMLRGGPAETASVTPMDRVFLEVGTICIGFRLSSGSGSECEAGADVDLSIVDFANSRFELIAQLGVADLGAVNAGAASLAGVQFGSRASLIVGHTYAVQLSGNRVGLMTVVRQLTPMQLAAEAKRRFGRSAIRIVSRLGGTTGAVEAGDVSGVARGSDALTYFELAFTAQQ